LIGVLKGLELLKEAKDILKEYPLCDRCLGRQFAQLGTGLSNSIRGKAIKVLLTLKACLEGDEELLSYLARTGFEPAISVLKKLGKSTPAKEECYVCLGIFNKLPALIKKALAKLKEYEFDTFVVGSRVPHIILEREEELRRRFPLGFDESIKREINRLAGKKLSELLGKEVNFREPDVTVIFDLSKMVVEVEVKPLFVYGRYRKLRRGLAQSLAKGGVSSVEYIVGEVLLRSTKGEGYKLHGAGREDVDVRTLGPGRPFVLEVTRPRVRKINLKAVEEEVNSKAKGEVEIHGLKLVSKDYVSKLKALSQYFYKTYRALVEFKGEVDPLKVKLVEEKFKDILIKQRTPLRVLHRRKDKVRSKRVYYIKSYLRGPKIVEFIIKCQGGLYVKELIAGDEGRTKPNIAEIVGEEPVKIELDILDLEGLD